MTRITPALARFNGNATTVIFFWFDLAAVSMDTLIPANHRLQALEA